MSSGDLVAQCEWREGVGRRLAYAPNGAIFASSTDTRAPAFADDRPAETLGISARAGSGPAARTVLVEAGGGEPLVAWEGQRSEPRQAVSGGAAIVATVGRPVAVVQSGGARARHRIDRGRTRITVVLRRSRSLVIAAAVLLTPAAAEATHAPSKPVGARNFTYEPTPTVIGRGDHLSFTNFDSAPHDVTARDTGGDGRPLFASRTVGQGGTTPVEGVEKLPVGAYAFYCSVHPFMTGALAVAASAEDPGPPPAPPEAKVVGAVPTPTSLTAAKGSLFVASWAGDAVYELPLLPGGAPGPATPYVTGVSAPLGVAMADDGTLFVADSHAAATPGRSTAGRVWAIPPGGGDAGEVGEIVVDELPNGRHNTNGLAIRDGRLYIANGNSTDDGVGGGDPEQPLSGTLLSVPLDARGVVVGQASEAAIRVEATGMRNVYDVAFRPGTSEAWMTFNGPDEQDPWGEDLLLRTNVADLAPADDFGFPGCLYARGQSSPWRQNANGAVTDVCDGTHRPPEQLMGLHVSADGLAFGPPGGVWDGDLFVAEFGNFFGREVVGHRVVRVPVDASGASRPPEDVVVGGAPLDVAFAGEDLYVADFAAGVLLVKPAMAPRARARAARTKRSRGLSASRAAG